MTVVGCPPSVGAALATRADVRALAVDAPGASGLLAEVLGEAGLEVIQVGPAGLGPAVVSSTLVLVEADALGTGGLVANTGSLAAAAVARHAGIPTWVVVGVGRALPAGLWASLVDLLGRDRAPWDEPREVLPVQLAGALVGPDGMETADEAVDRAGCVAVTELARR